MLRPEAKIKGTYMYIHVYYVRDHLKTASPSMNMFWGAYNVHVGV